MARLLNEQEQARADQRKKDRLLVVALLILTPIISIAGFLFDYAYRKAIVKDAIEEVQAEQQQVNNER